MKASDYIAEFLAKQNVRDAFVLTGGCIVHSIDSIARRKDMRYIPVQHEQSGAMAADAYSRVTGNLGVVLTTSGPGATNLLTGTCCSYYDSIPVLAITGQVPSGHLKRNDKMRQFGFQETDVVSIFDSVTKYSKLIEDPKELRYELEKATYLAKEGRPGPTLLDICDDVQRADINPENLRRFNPEPRTYDKVSLEGKVEEALNLMKKAERPVVILGGGIRLAGKVNEAKNLVENLGFPYTLTWAAMDYLSHDSPFYTGGFGTTSPRDGNFAVQNSDLIVALGTRLDTHEAGSKLENFARGAKKIIVDLDKEELEKYEPRGMNVDLPIQAELGDFFETINPLARNFNGRNLSSWVDKIGEWRRNYPVLSSNYLEQKGSVNPYVFMDALSRESKEGDVIISDCGSNIIWTMQGFKVKEGQRVISSFNHSPMGYSFPASMGAALAKGGPVTCITGDGGLQINIQELATMSRHNLPVRTFVLNNHGHGIIQGTLETWLEGRYHAANPDFGLPDPKFREIAEAYGVKTEVIRDHSELSKIGDVLNYDGPILCNVELKHGTQIEPKLLFGRPIEDSSPLLPRDEFKKNMIVEPVPGWENI